MRNGAAPFLSNDLADYIDRVQMRLDGIKRLKETPALSSNSMITDHRDELIEILMVGIAEDTTTIRMLRVLGDTVDGNAGGNNQERSDRSEDHTEGAG